MNFQKNVNLLIIMNTFTLTHITQVKSKDLTEKVQSNRA